LAGRLSQRSQFLLYEVKYDKTSSLPEKLLSAPRQ